VVEGSVGNTTTTVFATYGATIFDQTAEQTWSGIRNLATGDTVQTTDNRFLWYFASGDTTDGWNVLARTGFTFDTSGIPDTDTVSSATLSIFGSATTNGTTFTNGVIGTGNVYSFTPANATSYATADYDQFGTTAMSTGIVQSSWSDSAYNDYALNSTGIAEISKTGNTILGVRDQTYDAANVAPMWEAGRISRAGYRNYTASGTTNDPKLVIEHAAPAGPTNLKSLDGNLKANIKSVDGNLIANVKSIDSNA
jgi:hypothetical protein